MSFEEKIQLHIYPSKIEMEELHKQDLSREEICQIWNISISTYKKLRNYYNIPIKKKKMDLSTYPKRQIKIQQTLNERYGEPDSLARKEFYNERRMKQQQTCLEKYGVLDPSSLPEVIEKRKNTCIERYGVDNPMKNVEIQQKALQTDLEKYGSYHISSSIIRVKSKNTMLKKYGVEYSAQCPEILQKRNDTNLVKYGHKCCLVNSNIKAKAFNTMSLNNKEAVLSSTQQRYINDLFHGQLNYLFTYYHVDSYLLEDNIIIEYSGRGHDLSVRLKRETPEHFAGKEKARLSYFRNLNIPILEFCSKTDKLPNDEKLIQYFLDAKTKFSTGVLYYCVNLDTGGVFFQ